MTAGADSIVRSGVWVGLHAQRVGSSPRLSCPAAGGGVNTEAVQTVLHSVAVASVWVGPTMHKYRAHRRLTSTESRHHTTPAPARNPRVTSQAIIFPACFWWLSIPSPPECGAA